METRRAVYYKGNTVDPSPPTARNRRTRRALVQADAQPLNVIPERDVDRVSLARICVWCENALPAYHAICPLCRHCQFCGLLGDRLDVCRFCGNHEPDDIKPNRERRRIVKIGRLAREDRPGRVRKPGKSVRGTQPRKANRRARSI